MPRFAVVLLLCASFCWAQDPIAPHSALEPKAAAAAASLAASTKDSPRDLLTTGEKSDWNQTAPYAEAVEISRKLERASRFVKAQFGRIEKTVGVLLVATGVAFLTGGFQSASLWLIETFPQFGQVG